MLDKGPFRVEWHRNGDIVQLGVLTNARRHFRALDPYHSQLARDGQEGWLMLIDDATNEIVARRRLQPYLAPRLTRNGPRPSQGR